MSTVDDVFRRLPIARTVQPMARASEREEVKALLPQIPSGGILLLDRGYPGYDLIDYLNRHYRGYWLIRWPASAIFPAVEAFVRSGKPQATITRTPAQAQPITLRAIRMISADGELSVPLTTLQDEIRLPEDALIDLYFRRRAVGVRYRDEKTSLDTETFHSQIENGIRQELFAILIMAVIARILMALMTDPNPPSGAEPPFKHALITLTDEAFISTPRCPVLALIIFSELLHDIARVRITTHESLAPHGRASAKNRRISGNSIEPSAWLPVNPDISSAPFRGLE